MLIERKSFILTLAALGGILAIAGSTAILFTIDMAFRILASMINPEQVFERPASATFLPSLRQVLINYPAGFVSVLILAPFAVRRVLSSQYPSTGFVTTGFLYGAAAGFLCSWLVAL